MRHDMLAPLPWVSFRVTSFLCGVCGKFLGGHIETRICQDSIMSNCLFCCSELQAMFNW